MTQEKSKIRVVNRKSPGGWGVKEGWRVTLEDTETGRTYRGTVRLKAVNCGKEGCTKCPHRIYAYAQFRKGNKVTEKYLGVAR